MKNKVNYILFVSILFLSTSANYILYKSYKGLSSRNKNLKIINTYILKDNMIISEKNKDLQNQININRMQSFVQFTKVDMQKDIILTYSNISNRVKKQIIDAIIKASSKYNINPLILYSLIHTESSMRPWIEHTPTYIVKDKKKIKIRAVGLGGVVWEWWGDKLKANNIADVRSDLFDPTINIFATAFIYNEMFKKTKLKDAKTQDESAMIRYFGGNYKWYFQKINTKIAKLISTKIYRYSSASNTSKNTKAIKAIKVIKPSKIIKTTKLS